MAAVGVLAAGMLARLPVPAFAQSHVSLTEAETAALRQAYVHALMDAVERQWTRPADVPLDVPCPVRVLQLAGGEVAVVEVLPACPYDIVGRASVERAVIKAGPLPYRGFESVFVGTLVLNFRASDDRPVPVRGTREPVDPPPAWVDQDTVASHADACRRHLQLIHRPAGERGAGRRALTHVGLDGVLRAVRAAPTATMGADEDRRWERVVMSGPPCSALPSEKPWGNAGYSFVLHFDTAL